MRLFPASWRVEPANKVCDEIVDCLNKTAPTVGRDTGLKMIRTTNVKSGRIDLDNVRFLEDAVFRKWTRRLLPRRNDIVLTREAPLGEVGLLRSDDKAMLGQRTMVYRADRKSLDQVFLYYSLLGPVLQAQIKTLGSGSTVEHMRVPDAENLSVPLPPLGEQRKIAAMLSAYDDLIENNRRRIALLERMAEQLYREWFVRFRFPGYQQAKFAKGIPSNWRVAELSELAYINAGSIKKGREPESICYLDIGAVTTNTVEIPAPISYRDAPGRARRRVKHGDVIWSSVRPANRAYGLILEPPENLIASTGFAVISHREGIPFSFIKFAVTTDAFVEQMTAVAKGSAYPATSFGDFENAKLLLPTPDLLTEFDRLVLPMLTLAHRLGRQNEVLTVARDLLLPRLISGKLRVDDLDIRFSPSMQASA
jgi:type I restriction enzyme S subunit